MSGDDYTSRGRSSPARDAEDMIDHSTASERRTHSTSLDEARLRQQAIGVRLRQMFDEVVSEPIPEDFLAILRKADDRAGDS